MKTPLKILHVNTEKTWRGGERQACNLVKKLPRDEFVSIIAAPKHTPFFEHLTALGFTVCPFDMMGEWDVLSAWRLGRIVSHNAVSIIHAHSSHALGIAALTKYFVNVKLLASRRVDFHINKNIFSRWKYAQADTIAAISDGIKKVLLSDGIAADRISVVKSGIELDKRPDKNKESIKNKLRIPHENKVVGIIAALAPHKDHHTFVESAAIVKRKFKHTTFLIIGDGELKSRISRHIHSCGLNNNVIMTGFVSDVLNIIQILDVCVVSSYLEGMGTSTLDAMNLGVPVVATRVGGIPEIVADGCSGYLVPPRNPGALAEKIIAVLKDSKLAGRMGTQGKRKAQDYDIENTVMQTAEIYRRLTCKL